MLMVGKVHICFLRFVLLLCYLEICCEHCLSLNSTIIQILWFFHQAPMTILTK